MAPVISSKSQGSYRQAYLRSKSEQSKIIPSGNNTDDRRVHAVGYASLHRQYQVAPPRLNSPSRRKVEPKLRQTDGRKKGAVGRPPAAGPEMTFIVARSPLPRRGDATRLKSRIPGPTHQRNMIPTQKSEGSVSVKAIPKDDSGADQRMHNSPLRSRTKIISSSGDNTEPMEPALEKDDVAVEAKLFEEVVMVDTSSQVVTRAAKVKREPVVVSHFGDSIESAAAGSMKKSKESATTVYPAYLFHPGYTATCKHAPKIAANKGFNVGAQEFEEFRFLPPDPLARQRRNASQIISNLFKQEDFPKVLEPYDLELLNLCLQEILHVEKNITFPASRGILLFSDGERLEGTLRVRNTFSQPICFKVTVTNNSKYKIKPNQGILNAGKDTTITVVTEYLSSDILARYDTFSISSTVLRSLAPQTREEFEKFWQSRDERDIQRTNAHLLLLLRPDDPAFLARLYEESEKLGRVPSTYSRVQQQQKQFFDEYSAALCKLQSEPSKVETILVVMIRSCTIVTGFLILLYNTSLLHRALKQT